MVPEGGMEDVSTAIHVIGYRYIKGIGTSGNENEARKWLKMAFNNGAEEAAKMLGTLGSILE